MSDQRFSEGERIPMEIDEGRRIGVQEFVGYWPDATSPDTHELLIWRLIEIDDDFKDLFPLAWGVIRPRPR
jgi:hypothetical protein